MLLENSISIVLENILPFCHILESMLQKFDFQCRTAAALQLSSFCRHPHLHSHDSHDHQGFYLEHCSESIEFVTCMVSVAVVDLPSSNAVLYVCSCTRHFL